MNFTLFVTALLTGIAFVGIVTVLAKLIAPRCFNAQKEEAYEIELEQLNRMAEEALTAGRPLGKDLELLEQSRKADYMMLDIQQLREMLKEAEAAEKVTTEQPTDRNT